MAQVANAEIVRLQENKTALQKEVDAAIVARLAGASGASGVPTIDVSVAAFSDSEAASAFGASSDGLQIIAGACFICCGVVSGALFAMMLVTGEKSRRLVGQLRTIGLYESTYWSSWLAAYVPILAAMAIVLPLAGTGTGLSLFVHTDFSVHFAAAFLLGCAALANALCCASCVRRQGCVMAVSLLQFALTVIITILMAVLGIYSYVYTVLNDATGTTPLAADADAKAAANKAAAEQAALDKAVAAEKTAK